MIHIHVTFAIDDPEGPTTDRVLLSGPMFATDDALGPTTTIDLLSGKSNTPVLLEELLELELEELLVLMDEEDSAL